MLTLPPSVRVYIAAQPTDLRKSFDGLSALVAQTFGQDPLSGHLFVFRNRRGDQVRVLFWDRTGYAIVGKKLARVYRVKGMIKPQRDGMATRISLFFSGSEQDDERGMHLRSV